MKTLSNELILKYMLILGAIYLVLDLLEGVLTWNIWVEIGIASIIILIILANFDIEIIKYDILIKWLVFLLVIYFIFASLSAVFSWKLWVIIMEIGLISIMLVQYIIKKKFPKETGD